MNQEFFPIRFFKFISGFCIMAFLFTGVCYPQQGTNWQNNAPPAASRIKHQTLGISFITPSGWVCQQNQRGAIFGHNTIGGIIILAADYHSSMESIKQEMLSGISEEALTLSPVGTFAPAGNNCVSIQCQGNAQGNTVKGCSFGKLVSGGGGIFVTALAIPTIYSRELENTARAIIDTVEGPTGEDPSGRKAPPDLIKRFSGNWVKVSKYSQTSYRLYENGTFTTDSEASYGGNFSNGYQITDSWGTVNQSSNKGRWSVQGDETSGILTLQPAGEAPYRVKYHMHIEKGQRFPREYLFDGQLFQVTY